MAILTKAQQDEQVNLLNAKRTWVRPVYAMSPAADKVIEGKAKGNYFYFENNEYKTLRMVAVDRRFVLDVKDPNNELSQDEKSATVYTDGTVSDTQAYNTLVEKYGDDRVVINYETLVFLVDLKAFARFATKGYSKEVNKAIEEGELNVFVVEPNYHTPEKARFKSKLALFKVEMLEEECDPRGNEDYEDELARFKKV